MSATRCIVIIGAMKSGTTSLFNALSQHPEIVPVADKETRFFASDERFGRGTGWYESCHPPLQEGQWLLDGSTDCAKHPFVGDVPARLRAFGAKYKLIYIMRHPLRRIESQARHAQRYGMEVNEVRSDRADHSLDAGISPIGVALSRYAEQIDIFRDWYDRGDLLLLTLEEIGADLADVTQRVLAFVGLPPLEPPPQLLFQNRARDFREPKLLLRLLRRIPFLHATIRKLVPASVRGLVWRKRPIEGRFKLTAAEEQTVLASLLPDLVRLRDVYGIDAAQRWGIALPKPVASENMRATPAPRAHREARSNAPGQGFAAADLTTTAAPAR